MLEKSIKHIKLVIVIGFLLIFISVLSFTIFTKKVINHTELSSKQIDSLINEIGEVKEQNRLLTEKIDKKITREKIEQKSEEKSRIFKNSAREVKVTEIPKNHATDFLIVGHNSGLTDSIILASVNDELETISFISIPRDFYIGGRKINEYFEFFGIEKLIEKINEITGVKIGKYAIVNMEGFVELIDSIGGIDVTVEKSIYDAQFPAGKNYYSTYSIEKGDHHFTGEEALKYARSRKSTSDFDRSKRQQSILKAINEKLRELDSTNLISIYSNLLSQVGTNVNILESYNYFTKLQKYEFETGNVLSPDNFLYSLINEKGAYILLPKAGDYTEIQTFISDLINK